MCLRRLRPPIAPRHDRHPAPRTSAPSAGRISRCLATLLVIAAITGAIPPIVALGSDYDYPIEVWYSQTLSRLLIGAAFAAFAVAGARTKNWTVAATGWGMVLVALLHVVNDIVVLNSVDGTEVDDILSRIAYPTLLGVAALLAVVLGLAVLTADAVAWAGLLVLWGLCGLVEAFESYAAKVDTTTAPAADTVLVVQNLILMAAAILMYRASSTADDVRAAR